MLNLIVRIFVKMIDMILFQEGQVISDLAVILEKIIVEIRILE
jgi:hypothetical protein